MANFSMLYNLNREGIFNLNEKLCLTFLSVTIMLFYRFFSVGNNHYSKKIILNYALQNFTITFDKILFLKYS